MDQIFNAKTSEDMVDSWRSLVGGRDIDEIKEIFSVFTEKKPEIISFFGHQPLVDSLKRDVLDPKTRELVVLGILAAMNCAPGVAFHLESSMLEGASESEVMEVIFLSAYEHGKVNVASLGGAVKEGLYRVEYSKT